MMFHIVKHGDGHELDERYAVHSVVRAFALLKAARFEGEVLRLRDLSSRTGLHKTTAFRLLQTLEHVGAVERIGADQYRSLVVIQGRKRFRIGFAGKSVESAFSRAVGESLRAAAAERGLDLVLLDNRGSATTALRNADRLMREQIDVAVEFQVHERVAARIAAKFLEAGIPLIAVEIPHPGAVYFGGNNYEAGRLCGQTLGQRARQAWHGAVDEVLLLEMAAGGPLPHSSMTGLRKGLREVLSGLAEERFVALDGKGEFGASLEAVRRHLRRSRPGRCLVGAINDASALGALRAFEESGRARDCFVTGQNAEPEGRAEMRRAETRMVGSVGFFPERYGAELMRIALDLIEKRPVPGAVFVKHAMITARNVDAYYPNDTLLAPSGPADLVMRSL
ncbi:substrate-binding domain-containing protein [uncultured Paludibaculum sp.]|uniref:substrate-binding domain-containing protein n=1 Tax=uncultured Paludibaculum sp. TaxID=1765020 RepID=UPI002AAA756B|nr:substrate-binding domain-containing protein [uncultured Paludibaculum sp.]